MKATINPWTLLGGLTTALLAGAQSSAQWIQYTEVTATHTASGSGNPHSFPATGVIGTPDASEFDLASGDFNNDGWIDAVSMRKAPQYLFGQRHGTLMMNRNGVLLDVTALLAADFISNPSSARDVIATDVDGDGWIDLVVANTHVEDPMLYRNLCLDGQGNWLGFAIDLNFFVTEQGNPSFNNDAVPVGKAPGIASCAIAMADVDNDGDEDMYLSIYAHSNLETRDRLLINDGTGFFTEETSVRLVMPFQSIIATGVEAADMDGDGDIDFVLTAALQGYQTIFNNGSGVFTSNQPIPGAGLFYMHTLVDIDGDGDMDSYSVGDSLDRSAVSISATPGNIIWGAGQIVLSRQVIGLGGNAKSGDVDGDGKLEVGVCDLDTITASVGTDPTGGACGDGNVFNINRNIFTNANSPHFDDPYSVNIQPWQVDGAWDFEMQDFNNDGKLDLLVAGCTGFRYFHQQ